MIADIVWRRFLCVSFAKMHKIIGIAYKKYFYNLLYINKNPL